MVAATTAFGAPAEDRSDKYAPLRAALVDREREAVAGATEARMLAKEFEDFLNDPETETEEKPGLRKILLQEEARYRNLREQAVRLHTASEDLGQVPDHDDLTSAALKGAYEGLGDLGERGRAAWDNLIADRDATVDALQKQYARELAQATAAYEELDTVARANQQLLNAIDSHRADTTDAEFEVSLRLPRIKSAVELGFGIYSKPDDRNVQAQATLLALVGYSQFFWDYHAGVRTQLAENELPADSTRNVLGVSGGGVLLSDAVVENRSNYYYLSDKAKEMFNGRLEAIWGTPGSVTVTWWDQTSANNFRRACESLSTPTDRALLPNEHAFALLDLIDGLIEEKVSAAERIEVIHTRYRREIAEARDFGGLAGLSSAPFNALLWAKESEPSMAGFEAACRLLDAQLAESSQDDWTPNPKGISASVKSLKMIRKRVEAVEKVKEELADLLR